MLWRGGGKLQCVIFHYKVVANKLRMKRLQNELYCIYDECGGIYICIWVNRRKYMILCAKKLSALAMLACCCCIKCGNLCVVYAECAAVRVARVYFV